MGLLGEQAAPLLSNLAAVDKFCRKFSSNNRSKLSADLLRYLLSKLAPTERFQFLF